MSENRFDIQFNKKNFIRMFDNEKNEVVTETKAVDLLNSLYDENERLRSLHIDIIETIVKEPFYQEIFKEFLFENSDVLIKGE